MRILSGATVTTTRVAVGAIGEGLAQVVDGLTQGQVVVLADPSEALPTGNTLQRQRTGVGGLTGGGGGAFVRARAGG